MPRLVMTIRETAQYLRINRMTIYRFAQEGKIPAFKIGGCWRVDRECLDQWIENQIQERTNGKKK